MGSRTSTNVALEEAFPRTSSQGFESSDRSQHGPHQDVGRRADVRRSRPQRLRDQLADEGQGLHEAHLARREAALQQPKTAEAVPGHHAARVAEAEYFRVERRELAERLLHRRLAVEERLVLRLLRLLAKHAQDDGDHDVEQHKVGEDIERHEEEGRPKRHAPREYVGHESAQRRSPALTTAPASAARAAAEPPDEPPGPRFKSHGLLVVP